MKYALAVFDLDGTILDTLDDLADSTNAVLERYHLPCRSRDEVRQFVGNGIHKLIERAVQPETDVETVEKIYLDFLPWYRTHCAVKTRPYAGIPELLRHLQEMGMKTAVVSNKADPTVQTLCEQYFPGLFHAAYGERPGIARKPSPDAVLEVLHDLRISKEQAVYIGDSDVDIHTAQNADLDVISVDWGFRDREFLLKNGAGVIASNVQELMKLLR